MLFYQERKSVFGGLTKVYWCLEAFLVPQHYSFFMNQFITKNEDVIVESQVHLVFVNEKGKPVKVPDLIFDNFKPYFCDSIKS